MRTLAFILCMLASAPVVAQDSELPHLELSEPCASDVTENRSGAAEIEGVPALWFHREVARCLLGRLQVLPLYVDRVRLLERRLVLSDERDALRAREVALAVQEAETATEALEAAVRGRREAEEEAQQERDLRWLWVAGTAVVIVVLEGLAIWGFSQLRI